MHVQHTAITWSTETMWEVVSACMIMHSMIVEDKCDEGLHDKVLKF
jgi:hypothetical protein